MGLAPYGEPRWVDQVCQLIGMGRGGQFLLNLRYFDFLPARGGSGRRMYSDDLCRLFGQPPRRPGGVLTDFHRDVAKSLQLVLEEILLEKAHTLKRQTGARDLCLAGGVALNCVANGRLLREGPFERLFVPPAAGDDGTCLGAAALAHRELTGAPPPVEPLVSAFWGPGFSSDEVARLLSGMGLEAEDYRGREADLLADVAKRLAGGQVVGWFHGRMEHGPRALGARSILADPRPADARERVNHKVKKRESFRPFAPSVLASEAGRHFDLDRPSPFMLLTCAVRSPLELEAITHVDGSARPQTVDPETAPRFAALHQKFSDLTGCPVLLNTSFNVRGEPIVCTPSDALFCFADAGLDALVLEDFVVDRAALPEVLTELLPSWERKPPYRSGRGALGGELYTFV
jgi:carbamoyltransferase